VLEGSGVGVKKVVVHLEGENLEVRQEYETATDAFGNFRIEGVVAGEYGVTIQRLGFVPASGKQEEARITVGAGQEVTGLLYKMLLTGVVAGKITEADGDPMQGVSVWVTRVGKNGGEFGADGNDMRQSMLVSSGDAGLETTNDLGEYRIANLRAGQYIVQAQTHGMSPAPDPADRGKPREKPMYAVTYYPGTVELKQASLVQVTAGVTATANFSLMLSRSYRVSGTVTVAGNPRNVQMFLVSTTGQTEARSLGEGGKFEFLNVLPGTYVAQIVDMSGAGNGQAPETHTQMIGSPIVVSEADVTGLVLQPEAGGSVKGRVRTEGGEQLDWPNLNVSLVRVTEAEELPQMADLGALGGNSGLQDDGSFAVKDVAGGTYQVFVGGPVAAMQGYYLKSVLVEGREVVDTGFTVNGEMVLDVVMSAKGGSIEGTVVDGDGKAVSGATVVTMPSTGPGTGRAGRMDLYVTGQADASGHFVLSGLVPGAYVVVGLAEVDGDSRKAEFFEKYGGKGTVVDVDEGERKSVEVVEE
ncbi:MAG: carboxypeptidase-like regulatory domain-containing protein, partial [Candidatus Acidiferrum sp.]